MLNRILLGLDGSDSGQVALSFAMALAGPGAAVRVVHVNEFQLGGRGLTVETADEATALVTEAVTELHRAGIQSSGLAAVSTCFGVADSPGGRGRRGGQRTSSCSAPAAARDAPAVQPGGPGAGTAADLPPGAHRARAAQDGQARSGRPAPGPAAAPRPQPGAPPRPLSPRPARPRWLFTRPPLRPAARAPVRPADYDAAHEVRYRDSAVLLGRRVRPGGVPRLFRRGSRNWATTAPGRRNGAGHRAAAGAGRGDDLRGGVHRAAAARLRGVRIHPVQPGAPGQEPEHAGPAQPAAGPRSGSGTGGPGRPFAAFGVDPDRYVARFSEGLELMKALWTEPRVTFDGEFWQLQDAAMEPKPAQKPYPPLWFGANGPAALRRAVRLGDGFFGAGLDAHRDVRRAGADRARGAGRGGPAGRGVRHGQAGVHRGGRRRGAGPRPDERRAGAALRPPVGADRGGRGRRARRAMRRPSCAKWPRRARN